MPRLRLAAPAQAPELARWAPGYAVELGRVAETVLLVEEVTDRRKLECVVQLRVAGRAKPELGYVDERHRLPKCGSLGRIRAAAAACEGEADLGRYPGPT